MLLFHHCTNSLSGLGAYSSLLGSSGLLVCLSFLLEGFLSNGGQGLCFRTQALRREWRGPMVLTPSGDRSRWRLKVHRGLKIMSRLRVTGEPLTAALSLDFRSHDAINLSISVSFECETSLCSLLGRISWRSCKLN